jgi:hypothetical protein
MMPGPFPSWAPAAARIPEAVTPGTRRWAWFALPLACAAWFVVFATFGLLAFNLREDGYLLTLAQRMARGEVPYRDFSYIRPPLPIAIQATLLTGVPGYAIRGSRWYFATQVAVILAVVYSLLTRLEPAPGIRAAYAFLAVVVAFTGGFPAMPWHTLDGIFFSMLATWALVVGAERRSPGLAFTAGVAAGAASLSKQGFLLVAAAGLALTLTRTGRRIGPFPWAGALAYAAGGALIGATLLGYLMRHDAVGASVQSVLVAPRELTRADLHRGAWDLLVGTHLPSVGGALGGLAILALVVPRVPGVARFGLAVGGLAWVAGAFWLWPSMRQIYRLSLVEPVYTSVWLGGVGLIACHAAGRLGLPPSAAWALGLGLCTLYASGWSYEAIRSAVLALALPLPLVLIGLATAGNGTMRGPRVAAGCLLLYAGVLSLSLHAVVPYLDATRGELTTPFVTDRLRGIRSSPRRVRGVDGVVELVRRETAAGDYVFAFMDFPALYFLTERRNPTRVDWFLSQEVSAVERQQAIADLRARPPRLVILTALEPLAMVQNARLRPILGHILEYYEQGEAIGEFLVFRPRRR